MNYYIGCLLVLICLPGLGISAPVNENSSYWQCITQDKTNKQWTARNGYQKVALNIAFAMCKKRK